MELMDRYVYAVTSKLPAQQREDIEKELRGLIQDMLDERTKGGEASLADMEEVLLELGSPSRLADQYRGSGRYLIGPELFDSYLLVLKIVMAAIGITMAIVFGIRLVFEPWDSIDHLTDTVGSMVFAALQGFAWVTAVFTLLEYGAFGSGRSKLKAARPWKPSDLPQLPNRHTAIRRSDAVGSIVFTVIFTLFLTNSTELFGVWRRLEGEWAAVPFLNVDVFQQFLPYIWVATALSVIQESLKLIKGRWTLPMIVSELVVLLAHTALGILVVTWPDIWNADFLSGLAEAGQAPVGSSAYSTAEAVWTRAMDNIPYLIGLVFLVQAVVLGVRAFRLKGRTGAGIHTNL